MNKFFKKYTPVGKIFKSVLGVPDLFIPYYCHGFVFLEKTFCEKSL